jgi:hypothetical protein
VAGGAGAQGAATTVLGYLKKDSGRGTNRGTIPELHRAAPSPGHGNTNTPTTRCQPLAPPCPHPLPRDPSTARSAATAP